MLLGLPPPACCAPLKTHSMGVMFLTKTLSTGSRFPQKGYGRLRMKTPNNASSGKQIFKAVEDYEKRFFPEARARKKVEEKSKEPGAYGTTLTVELLKEIQQGITRAS